LSEHRTISVFQADEKGKEVEQFTMQSSGNERRVRLKEMGQLKKKRIWRRGKEG